MGKIYGIAISCTPSDRLIINENGEEFFECMNEEEMTIIQKEKDLQEKIGHCNK
ncbi:hypothetical protein [Helicobacter sp. T3_23-1056]